jgi:chromosome segregation ATPase
MAQTIEALLEENLGKVQELLQTSETLQNNLNEHLAPLDDAINTEVIPAVTASLDRMRAMNEALPKLQQALEQAEQEADSKLNDLDKQLDEVTQHIDKTEQSTDQILEQLETELTQISRSVETHEASVSDEFDNLKDVTNDFSELIDEGSKKVTHSVDGITSLYKTQFEAIDKHKDAIRGQLDELHDQCNEEVEKATASWVQAITDSEAKVEAAVTQIENQATAQLQTMETLYSKQLPAEMDENADALVQAIGSAGNGTNEVIAKTKEEFTAISASVDEVVGQLEKAKSYVNNILEST